MFGFAIASMRSGELARLSLVFALAAFFWLPNLETVPSWDWDEGYNLNYAWNIAEGRLLWFSIKYAFIPHPPLYLLALAVLVKLFGQTILVLRLFSVAMNFALIGLVYLVGRQAGGQKTGLLSAFLYAIYPSALYWGRIGFSNHMLSLLVVLSLYCFIRHVRGAGSWWLWCCVSAGLSAVTEPQGLFVCAAVFAYFAVRERRRLPAAASLLFGPFAGFSAYMAASSGYFLDDVAFQVERVNLVSPQLLIIPPVLLVLIVRWKAISGFLADLFEKECELIFGGKELFNLFYVPIALLSAHLILTWTLIRPMTAEDLFEGGDYYWLGLVGLLFLERVLMNSVVLVYFIPSFAAVVAFGRSDHMIIPMYPFFTLGLAVLMENLHEHLTKKVGAALALLLLAYPLPFVLYHDYSAYAQGGVLPAENLADYWEVTDWVRAHTGPGDFIITTSNLARNFGNATIITQAVVYEGYKIEYYHGRYPPGRYAFNISYRNADYVVASPTMVAWFENYAPGPAKEMEGWQVVNVSGSYSVYRNPTSV
jgi:hypothetical protein